MRKTSVGFVGAGRVVRIILGGWKDAAEAIAAHLKADATCSTTPSYFAPVTVERWGGKLIVMILTNWITTNFYLMGGTPPRR